MTTYRTLPEGEAIPPNAEFLCEGEWIKTGGAGLLSTAGVEYRVPLDKPEPTTTMRNQINDGGAAFPRTGADGHTSPQAGMSLRDYFAGQALAALRPNGDGPWADGTWADLALDAYDIADAMLTARNQQ